MESNTSILFYSIWPCTRYSRVFLDTIVVGPGNRLDMSNKKYNNIKDIINIIREEGE